MEYLKGLAHVAVKVCDLDRAIRFYEDGLGMAVRHKAPDAAIVAPPDGVVLELFAGGEYTENKSGFTHFCLNTCDADAAFLRAVDCGARPSRGEPYDLGRLRIAFVTAPTGEEVEFWHIGEREPAGDGRYVKSVVHAALTVPAMDAVTRFYEGLGIRFKTGWGWGCSMKMGDGRELELFTKGEVFDNKSGITHVCFETDDIDAALARAVELGGAVADEPREWENVRYAFFRGLAGELVELFTFLPDREKSFFLPPSPFPESF
jgi:catechol 2,3-dioxygenase-like lactoylglutathione lyase family enzyme